MSTAHSPRHEEMLPAYALGALDGEELRELEAHLPGCDECRRLLRGWEDDLEQLAAAAPPLEPSAEVRRRILGATGAAPAAIPARSEPVRRRSQAWVWLPLAAALALLVVGLARQARLQGEIERLQGERDQLAQQVTALDQQLVVARGEAQRMAEALSVINAPGGRAVRLAGLGPTPEAFGHTFIDPERGRALFYAARLPELAPDKDYQLWFFADGKPVPAGVFDVDTNGNGSVRVDRLASDIQGWAVTIEPRGGLPAPSGDIVLKG
ncbi:MAG TPA: anti-sigma factor [Thermoanaerobaculia bacterium]|nr:anti-sigma factor [Thermoanaerobaculia bacterium]